MSSIAHYINVDRHSDRVAEAESGASGRHATTTSRYDNTDDRTTSALANGDDEALSKRVIRSVIHAGTFWSSRKTAKATA